MKRLVAENLSKEEISELAKNPPITFEELEAKIDAGLNEFLKDQEEAFNSGICQAFYDLSKDLAFGLDFEQGADFVSTVFNNLIADKNIDCDVLDLLEVLENVDKDRLDKIINRKNKEFIFHDKIKKWALDKATEYAKDNVGELFY